MKKTAQVLFVKSAKLNYGLFSLILLVGVLAVAANLLYFAPSALAMTTKTAVFANDFEAVTDLSCSQTASQTDLWDISQGVTVTNSSGVRNGADGRDMFGGNFGSTEIGNVLFIDSESDGFVHFIEWQTPVPVTTQSFNLIAGHDHNSLQRSFREFRLYGFDPNTSSYQLLYTLIPPLPYGEGNFSNLLFGCGNVPALTTDRFRAEFVQNGNFSSPGPRIMELDGSGLPITAASVSIGGRVLTASGEGVRNAVVTLTKPSGEVLTVRTGSFGYYRFDDLPVGEIYVLNVYAKSYSFEPRVVQPNDDVTDADFIAEKESADF